MVYDHNTYLYYRNLRAKQASLSEIQNNSDARPNKDHGWFNLVKQIILNNIFFLLQITTHFLNMNTNDPKIDIQVKHTSCNTTECTVDILAKPTKDFCSYFDFVDVVVRVQDFTEEAIVRYYVPCSCECSKKMEINSKKCNEHGNYTCGLCACDSDWWVFKI